MNKSDNKIILVIIVVSQFLCTSLWFAGNSIMPDLVKAYDLDNGFLGFMVSAVQLGFITGTLIFGLLAFADKFSPSRFFFVCAAVGAIFNLGIIIKGNNAFTILLFRYLTGVSLAGIYPIGMKIASDYFKKGLGKSLGFMVGALVLGTASPHLIKYMSASLPWNYVIYTTSLLSLLGGSLMLVLVPKGPHHTPFKKLSFSEIIKVFNNSNFKSAAFGYFGHMWELYTFWAFVPVMLRYYSSMHPNSHINISFTSFSIIGMGAITCVLGGFLADGWGTKRTASYILAISCACCLLSPISFFLQNEIIFISFLVIWGLMVIADSPLFSTLVAQSAPDSLRGSALTLVNCIGFFITIVSIQITDLFYNALASPYIYIILAFGPILGLINLLNSRISVDSENN